MCARAQRNNNSKECIMEGSDAPGRRGCCIYSSRGVNFNAPGPAKGDAGIRAKFARGNPPLAGGRGVARRGSGRENAAPSLSYILRARDSSARARARVTKLNVTRIVGDGG